MKIKRLQDMPSYLRNMQRVERQKVHLFVTSHVYPRSLDFAYNVNVFLEGIKKSILHES